MLGGVLVFRILGALGFRVFSQQYGGLNTETLNPKP